MMRAILLMSAALALPFAASAAETIPARDEWFRELDLEPIVERSELILVTRIEEVREIPMPVGGKGESALMQVRFKPLRTLKGVFARDTLTLTSYDLGAFEAQFEIARLAAGDLRLLFLGRSRGGYHNLHVVPNVDWSLPPLRGEDDPLTASVKTLLDVAATPERTRRVTLLVDALSNAQGAAAVPLLKALPRRAVVAAQMEETLAAVARYFDDESPSVRLVAAEVLSSIVAADYLGQRELRVEAARVLEAALDADRPSIAANVALLGAIGELGPQGSGVAPPLTSDAPFAIQQAQITAAGRTGRQSARFDALLAGMPLDHPNAGSCENELARTNPGSAASLLPSRARSKLAAGLSITDEIRATTLMPAALAATTLVQMGELPLNAYERHAFAMAAGSLAATWAGNPALHALVAPLSGMLDPADGSTRAAAMDALFRINTAEAARALQPYLREETDLSQKLQMAQMLGRHGLDDGYPYAIEHMSEPELLERAVAALAAIGDPRAIEASRSILETSNDHAWNAAAIRVLGAMGDRGSVARFLEIVADRNHPLAPAALIALGDLGEPKALAAIREGLDSRSDAIVAASASAAGRLLKQSGDEAADLRDALARLVADPRATAATREAALESLVSLADPRLDAALATAADDAGLEGGELLYRIETLLRQRKVQLAA